MGDVMTGLLSDAAIIDRVLDHIDNKTTDVCDAGWRVSSLRGIL